MTRALTSVAVVLSSLAALAAQSRNVEVLSQITRPGVVGYSGVWGHVDARTGRELAVVGTLDGTWIVETTDPRRPVERGFFPAARSDFWREVMVYRHYAYSVTEKYGGVRIFDLSDPDRPRLANVFTLPGWDNTHTIAFDHDRGHLYCNGTSLGCLVFDLADPIRPKLITRWTTRYVHDAFIQDGFAWFSSTTDGRLWIVDVTRLPAMTTVHAFQTSRRKTHNAVLTSDNALLLTTDDINDAPLQLWDIRNKRVPRAVGSWTPSGPPIHNVFLRDDKIAHAVQISGPYHAVDVSQPDSPRVVARQDGVFAWGSYPYQPSRTVYVTSIPPNGGLYCLRLKCGVAEHYGSATAGSGGHEPELDWARGHARVGNSTYELVGREMLGGANAALLLGAASASLRVLGIELLIDLGAPAIVISTTANGSGPGGGSARVRVAIPNHASLAGGVVHAQWIVADPGGPQGFAASRGARIAICR